MRAALAGMLAAAAYLVLLILTDGIVTGTLTSLLLLGLGLAGWTALVGLAHPAAPSPSEAREGLARRDARAPARHGWRRRGGRGGRASDHDAPPARLVQLERTLSEAAGSAVAEHHRLRPVLASLAADRLAAAHHVSLDRDPARSRALLGEQAWELLRPDRPPPYDRDAPGRGAAGLAAIVAAIEEAGPPAAEAASGA